ncbi:hypothetical protein B0H11DRAFT_2186991 [Mycena galericulata]|nr:hypothetical protein B0H11DRAFT_2186991 [Mycena galericulata]
MGAKKRHPAAYAALGMEFAATVHARLEAASAWLSPDALCGAKHCIGGQGFRFKLFVFVLILAPRQRPGLAAHIGADRDHGRCGLLPAKCTSKLASGAFAHNGVHSGNTSSESIACQGQGAAGAFLPSRTRGARHPTWCMASGNARHGAQDAAAWRARFTLLAVHALPTSGCGSETKVCVAGLTAGP